VLRHIEIRFVTMIETSVHFHFSGYLLRDLLLMLMGIAFLAGRLHAIHITFRE